MGHILFGLPEISQYHLHSRLARKLMTREHRVTVLAGDPVTFEFYCHQGLACVDLGPRGHSSTHLAPLTEFAQLTCQLQGHQEPGPGRKRRAEVALERRVEPLLRIFETDPPELVLISNGRSGLHRLLHFLAVQHGIKVLHVGDGLLPMTMQVDAEGIDGDSSFCRARRQDYRRTTADEMFLAAATASWLGRAHPPPLARMGISVPPVMGRAMATVQAMVRRQWRAAWHGMTAWESAHDVPWPLFDHVVAIPPAPYGVVLLQPANDPRRRLDNPSRTPDRALIEQARAAIRRADHGAQTVVVQAIDRARERQRGRARGLGRGLGFGLGLGLGSDHWPDDVIFVPPATAPAAVATAMAVISINHPLGLAGILTETPVLHLGRTPYGVRGICRRTSLDQLSTDLQRALDEGSSPVRKRFLSRILKDHHIWCPEALPDGNGIAGLVLRMEKRMQAQTRKPLKYRPGPVWPLSVG